MPQPSRLVEVVTTVATEEEAARLASDVVGAGLAACAHVQSIRSLYRWRSTLQDERETRLTFKTTEERAEALERRLAEIHPYDTPMILRRAVSSINPEYLEWARENTRETGR